MKNLTSFPGKISSNHRTTRPTAPAGLSATARAWWRKLTVEYEIRDAGGLLILENALLALDRVLEARRIIGKEGLTTLDRFGQAKVHPCVLIERDNRGLAAKLLKDLHLDLEPVLAVGRPPGPD